MSHMKVDLRIVHFYFFQMTGDQDITGHFNFRGNVHVHHDFNPRSINGIDTAMFIPLNSRSPIVGKPSNTYFP